MMPSRTKLGTCDFCCVETELPYTFTATNFELPEYGYRSVGEWRACTSCYHLINENKWDEVREHAMAEFLRRQPDANPVRSERFILDLHDAFRLHRTETRGER